MILVEKTNNKKTGPIAVTHLAQSTCPKTCPLYKKGCYAEKGTQWLTTNALNKREISALESASMEIESLKKRKGTGPLRLHIVGDFISQAHLNYATWVTRSQTVWAYTHNWRNLRPTTMSVLASVHSIDEAKQAHSEGWVPAIVVEDFKSSTMYEQDGFKILPCPEQTGKKATCKDCLICTHSRELHAKKVVIAFKKH